MKELLIWEEEGELKYLEFERYHNLTFYIEQDKSRPYRVFWNLSRPYNQWFSNVFSGYRSGKPTDLEQVELKEVPANIRAFALLLT